MQKLKISVLEQKASIHILLALREHEQLTVSDLVRIIPYTQPAIYTAKTKLVEAGLIEQEKKGGFPFTVIHKLTPKGRKVAEKLLEIEKILES